MPHKGLWQVRGLCSAGKALVPFLQVTPTETEEQTDGTEDSPWNFLVTQGRNHWDAHKYKTMTRWLCHQQRQTLLDACQKRMWRSPWLQQLPQNRVQAGRTGCTVACHPDRLLPCRFQAHSAWRRSVKGKVTRDPHKVQSGDGVCIRLDAGLGMSSRNKVWGALKSPHGVCPHEPCFTCRDQQQEVHAQAHCKHMEGSASADYRQHLLEEDKVLPVNKSIDAQKTA